MGCCSSKILFTKETERNNNSAQEHSSKKNELITKDEARNEINLIYYAEFDDNFQIFGKQFVKNNKDNIDLIIGENQIKLVDKYYFKKGDNKVTIKIKNKLTNLSYMFSECEILKDIIELKYLNVSESDNFEYMFYGCNKLKDLKPLENWNVSKSNNFACMFSSCKSLSNIKNIENWNVSNGNNFQNMFSYCDSLSDITALKH